jgi:hypothetical protein
VAGGWQVGTVQAAAKMNILKEENILYIQNILKYGTELINSNPRSSFFLFIHNFY